jgi:hypothetical protein
VDDQADAAVALVVEEPEPFDAPEPFDEPESCDEPEPFDEPESFDELEPLADFEDFASAAVAAAGLASEPDGDELESEPPLAADLPFLASSDLLSFR